MPLLTDIPDFIQQENPHYLTEQLITYIGNKRALLDFINQGVTVIKDAENKQKLKCFDVFSGSGIVSRFLKQHSSFMYTNDLEQYAKIISKCYLTNAQDLNFKAIIELHELLINECKKEMKKYLNEDQTLFTSYPGFISELYAPENINDIKIEERCFYTPYNACYLDCMRQSINKNVPLEYQHFFIAPLLSEASIHANTGGIFKGFYKNSHTGIGKFGGTAANALSRITGKIELKLPVLSNFSCPSQIFCSDANTLVLQSDSPSADLAYIDPPYNQHPYGSNYFMLNLIASYKKPDLTKISRVSGIPKDWNRSLYNKRKDSSKTFADLARNINAKYLLISFNNEGFIETEEMLDILNSVGKVKVIESQYNAFRASRNLSSRNIHTKEYLYIVKKN